MNFQEEFITTHKKNMETVHSMTVLASDMMQSVMQMQSEYIQDLFHDMKDMLKVQSPLEMGQKFQNFANKAHVHGTKIWDKAKQTGADAKDTLSQHLQDQMSHFKKN